MTNKFDQSQKIPQHVQFWDTPDYHLISSNDVSSTSVQASHKSILYLQKIDASNPKTVYAVYKAKTLINQPSLIGTLLMKPGIRWLAKNRKSICFGIGAVKSILPTFR
jgi:hypothetical protein